MGRFKKSKPPRAHKLSILQSTNRAGEPVTFYDNQGECVEVKEDPEAGGKITSAKIAILQLNLQ